MCYNVLAVIRQKGDGFLQIINSHIIITCPVTGREEKMYYRIMTETELCVCNGCDNSNGGNACKKCIADTKEKLITG